MFWAIMLKQKDGPFNIFKMIRNRPALISYPVIGFGIGIAAVPVGALGFMIHTFYPLNVAAAISLWIVTALILGTLIQVTGAAKWFSVFVGKIMACAACSPFWITLICIGPVLLIDWSIIPLLIFGITGLSYVGLSLVGVNDLKD